MIITYRKRNSISTNLITKIGTYAHICHQDFIDIKTLGFNVLL